MVIRARYCTPSCLNVGREVPKGGLCSHRMAHFTPFPGMRTSSLRWSATGHGYGMIYAVSPTRHDPFDIRCWRVIEASDDYGGEPSLTQETTPFEELMNVLGGTPRPLVDQSLDTGAWMITASSGAWHGHRADRASRPSDLQG